jgi:TolA-binding protein
MKKKRYYNTLLVGLLFLSTVVVSCTSSSQGSVPISSDEKQPITTQDQLKNMDGRISELEREVQSLNEENARLSQSQKDMAAEIQALKDTTSVTQTDTEAIMRLAYYTAVTRSGFYDYIVQRFGKFLPNNAIKFGDGTTLYPTSGGVQANEIR